MRRLQLVMSLVAMFATGLATTGPVAAQSPPDTALAVGPEVPIRDAIFDEARDLVYATVPAHADVYPNEVIAFDPANGSIAWSAFQASHCAISSAKGWSLSR